MGLDRQLEQLCTLYAEKSDTELLALHAQRDDLTDLAQEALAQVMKERKLCPAEPQPLEDEIVSSASLDLAPDEVGLWTFDDAYQANRALDVLAKAGIAHRPIGWSQTVRGDAVRGSALHTMRLAVVVKKRDEAQAREVLQQTMNLFPPPEGDDDFDEPGGMVPAGVFARQDALAVAHALGTFGLCYLWSDDREDPSATTDEVQIEVNAHRLEQAQQIVERTLMEQH